MARKRNLSPWKKLQKTSDSVLGVVDGIADDINETINEHFESKRRELRKRVIKLQISIINDEYLSPEEKVEYLIELGEREEETRRNKKMTLTKPLDAIGELLYVQSDHMLAENEFIRTEARVDSMKLKMDLELYKLEIELKKVQLLKQIEAAENGEVPVQEESTDEISAEEQAAMDFDPSQVATKYREPVH